MASSSVRLYLLLLVVWNVCAEVVQVAPGGHELQSCVDSGATTCILLPGIHRESVVVNERQPVHIVGSGSSTVMSGSEAVDGPWTVHAGVIYKAQLPAHLHGIDIQQAWHGDTWLPEARWPDVNLTDGNAATESGGPLSKSTWATTYGIIGQNDSCLNCTRLRDGVIVDPALAATGIDWTGALATLNVGFRFFTCKHDL
jgi:hypothetical protein